MTVHLWDHKLTYVSVPKCACSTAKLHLHHVATGAPFERAKGGPSIHAIYTSRPFQDLPHDRISNHLKLTVIRGPVSRVLSAYQNKIVADRCLHKGKVRWACRLRRLDPDPDIGTFLAQLDDYRAVSRIVRTHTEPLHHFLGDDPKWFDHIFSIRHMQSFQDRIASHTGIRVPLGHGNKSKGRLAPVDLDPDQRRALRARFASDWDIYGSFFAKDAPADGLVSA